MGKNVRISSANCERLPFGPIQLNKNFQFSRANSTKVTYLGGIRLQPDKFDAATWVTFLSQADGGGSSCSFNSTSMVSFLSTVQRSIRVHRLFQLDILPKVETAWMIFFSVGKPYLPGNVISRA